jgi:hypothetical protein
MIFRRAFASATEEGSGSTSARWRMVARAGSVRSGISGWFCFGRGQILKKKNNEAVRWQLCAICDPVGG